jgi:hypothetical protein
MKSIPMCNLFDHVVINTIGSLPKIVDGNKCILVTIDCYSNWCEKTSLLKKHNAFVVVRFLQRKIISKFNVPKLILIDKRSECMIFFDEMCQNYGIIQQFIVHAWPQCNGMTKRLIKTWIHCHNYFYFTTMELITTKSPLGIIVAYKPIWNIFHSSIYRVYSKIEYWQ